MAWLLIPHLDMLTPLGFCDSLLVPFSSYLTNQSFSPLCWVLLCSLISKCCSDLSPFLSVLFYLPTFLWWSLPAPWLSVSATPKFIFPTQYLFCSTGSHIQLPTMSLHVSCLKHNSFFFIAFPVSVWWHFLVAQASGSLDSSFSHTPHLICQPIIWLCLQKISRISECGGGIIPIIELVIALIWTQVHQAPEC